MKKRGLFITLASGLSLTLALLWILGSQSSSVVAAPSAGYAEAPNAPAAELHVCPAGPPTCDYSSVQTAVDAADSGDLIKVAAGIYTGVSARKDVTQVVYISKTVTVQGGYTTSNWTISSPKANPTTLDAQEQGRVLYIAGNINPTIEGLHITGGNAAGLGGDPFGDDGGGGVYIITATATINNNWVYSNSAEAGAGIYPFRSDATISNNIIDSNTASSAGGGMMSTFSDITVDGNTFSNNSSPEGGGLHLHRGNGATVINNVVISNTSYYLGGGMYLYRADATLTNNVVANNQATDTGSGLFLEQCSPHLSHTTIARNTDGDSVGVYVAGGGSGPVSSPTFTNTILVAHAVGIRVTAGNTATLEATLWGSGIWANTTPVDGNVISSTNVTGDPAFVDPDTGNYHIRSTSKAIDAGVNANVTADIDGESRPAGTGYDIGADEFWCRIYLPLVLRQ